MKYKKVKTLFVSSSSSAGLIIPKDMLALIGLSPGDKIEVSVDTDDLSHIKIEPARSANRSA